MHTQEATEKLTLTAAEAGALLGVSPATIYRQAAEGRIPHVRMGDRLIIPRAAFEQWLFEKAQASVKWPH